MTYTKHIENYIGTVKEVLDMLDSKAIEDVLHCLEDARNTGKKVYIMGNGGSASTASHFVCDFNKGVKGKEGKNYKFICLNDNIPSMMAYANDVSYDHVFVGQLESHLEPGDIVIGISASGNSPNVVNAIRYAKESSCTTIGLTGFCGGELKKLVDYSLHVPIDDYQIAEDIHMVLDHMMSKVLMKTHKEDE